MTCPLNCGNNFLSSVNRYDYMLGGKDNYQADRDAAARLLRVLPDCERACRANRDFLQRAVRYLTASGPSTAPPAPSARARRPGRPQ